MFNQPHGTNDTTMKEYTRPQVCDIMDAAHDAITELNLTAAKLCQIASPAQQQEYDKQINELRRLIDSMGQFYLRITKK